MAVVCSAPKGEKDRFVPRNGLLTAWVFELVQPVEPTIDRAVMRAYRANPPFEKQRSLVDCCQAKVGAVS
jgi:hypothetical protein